MAEVNIAEAARYASADADVTLRLTERLAVRLAENPALQRLMDQMELPLMLVLLEMEMGGFAVDLATLRELGVQVDQLLNDLTRRIFGEAGHPLQHRLHQTGRTAPFSGIGPENRQTGQDRLFHG